MSTVPMLVSFQVSFSHYQNKCLQFDVICARTDTRASEARVFVKPRLYIDVHVSTPLFYNQYTINAKHMPAHNYEMNASSVSTGSVFWISSRIDNTFSIPNTVYGTRCIYIVLLEFM